MVNLATEYKSLTHYTKGTQSHHEGAPTACTYTVSGSISLPSQGFFSPFPHGTGSLSVNWEYLALEDGPPIFSQSFTCSDLLNMSNIALRVRDYHPLLSHFPECSTKLYWFGCFPFARRYLGNLGWFLFLRVLRCFSSPGLPLLPMYSVADTLKGWVSPFGNSGL